MTTWKQRLSIQALNMLKKYRFPVFACILFVLSLMFGGGNYHTGSMAYAEEGVTPTHVPNPIERPSANPTPTGPLPIEGQPWSSSGYLNIIWGDGPEGATQTIYTLTDDSGQRTPLLLDETLSQSVGGVLRFNRKKVKVAGAWATSLWSQGATTGLYVTSISLALSPESGALSDDVSPGVIGSKPWVTIMCKFSDFAVEPHDLTFFTEMYADTNPGLDHYWRELSYNTANVAGSSASGWFVLPHPEAYYNPSDTRGGTDLNLLATDCIAAANPSVNFAAYTGINMMFNTDFDNGYAWGGSRYMTLDGVTKTWSTTWEPPWAYANISVIQHEMGHGFGLPHSSGAYGQTYDNAWDVMSQDRYNCAAATDPIYGCIAQHTISYHKDILGWISAGEKFTAPLGSTTTITLEQLALPANGNYKMAQIPIGGSSTHFYTVEARRLTGYDSKLAGAAVIIHEVDTTRTRPAYVIDPDNNGVTSDAGAMWVIGETFVDATNNISVRVDSATATGFQVTIINDDVMHFEANTDVVTVPEGGTGSFQVRLSAQPASNVVVSVSRYSGDTDISVVSGSSLTFTASNWSVYQTVTVGAAEDVDTVNGSAVIRVSAAGVPSKDVTANESDNDSLAFVTNTDVVTVPEGGTAIFQVRLTAPPSSNLVASVSRVSGDANISVVSGSSLTFTASNWNVYQTVTLSAAEDADTVNGSGVIRVSAAGVPSRDVTANESDNDSLDFETDTDVVTVPEGSTATFQVRLTAQPSSNVVASVSRVSGDANISVVSGSSLTFTTSNWSVNQTVTLGAAEDADTANGSAVIRVSATGMASVDVVANELDNDTLPTAPSDFNRDGNPDILWRHKVTGEVALWYMNGASPVSPQGIATVPDGNWKIVGVGDFDRDGDPDILWRNQATGEVALWYMNGASPVSPQGIATVPDTNWRIVGVGDFNRDGNPDILWQHQGTGEVALWYMNGASLVSPQGIATVPANWKIVGVGDFDRDGDPDILWWHQGTGEVALWYMNGPSPVSPQGIATVPTNWRIMGVADFNRDGNPDILWRHQTTGEMALWYMNGPNLVSPQGIATVPDLNWEIVAP